MTAETLKLLLVGPLPPPHGGISVHLSMMLRSLRAQGTRCAAIDAGGHRPRTGAPSAALGLLRDVRRHARSGYVVHLHANGHNERSWLQALGCGLAARAAPGRVLTLHSGLLPSYLSAHPWRRRLARAALRGFDQIVCVNPSIQESIASLGVGAARLRTLPAYVPAHHADVALPPGVSSFLSHHHPLLTTVLWFRPEYAFERLLEGFQLLRARHPRLGLLVMGGGEGEADARTAAEIRGGGDVFLAGDVAHDLCLALISRSQLFVRPTLVDGDSISVRESLALGVPVVASDAGDRPDGVMVFPRGDVGRFVDTVDAALRAGAPAALPLAPGSVVEELLHTYREASRKGA